MDNNNPFVLPTDEYVRQIDPFGQALDQYAQYLHQMTGKPLDVCKAGAAKIIKEKQHPTIRNPQIEYYQRGSNGDKSLQTSTLYDYIYDSLRAKEIIAPTLTTYLHPSVKESHYVKYVSGNIKGRNVAKKAMFRAIAALDTYGAVYYNREQNNRKTKNNSLSGMQVSTSTPMHNKTAHSTLTSNCRSTSGYGNANNEKFLSGNRHYHGFAVVMNNITSIITIAEYDRVQAMVLKYKLHIPTADEVMECITYSTNLYWRNHREMEKIRALVDTLTDLQRVCFVYYGDFHHFKKHNESLAREIIGTLASKVEGVEVPNALEYLKNAAEERIDLARSICRAEMVGVKKTDEAYQEISNEPRFHTLVATLANINYTIATYSDFIRTFWTSPTVPASMAYFPKSVRRSALISDTDSTIFTVQDWVMWFYQKKRFKAGTPVADVLPFLAAQSITHVLAKMSANFGIEKSKLYDIAMKSEFKFDVMVPTNVAKHYYAIMNVQEGIIIDPAKYEIKGVHLKNSNIPKAIVSDAQDMMKNILNTVAEGETIKIRQYLTHVADVERDLMAKLRSGELLRTVEIKNAASYTKPPNQSPYGYHILWEEVFAPKYGSYSEPPYAATRIATTLDNPTKFNAWLNSLEDKELAQRMSAWAQRNGKKTLPSLMIPKEALGMHGIPQELILAMNIRKIVSDLCNIYYIVLETLGFYLGTLPTTIRLVCDQY